MKGKKKNQGYEITMPKQFLKRVDNCSTTELIIIAGECNCVPLCSCFIDCVTLTERPAV